MPTYGKPSPRFNFCCDELGMDRNLLNPEYDANLPAAVATTSTNNITRERGWRPLWERELENVLAAWRTGQEEYGYDAQDLFHKYVKFRFFLQA
jgi:hypothetical protein